MSEDYGSIYEIDAADEYFNGAYDEDGEGAYCSYCDSALYYDCGEYVCRECGERMSRAEYFNYIGAEPPGSACYTGCMENYPLCREQCEIYNPTD